MKLKKKATKTTKTKAAKAERVAKLVPFVANADLKAAAKKLIEKLDAIEEAYETERPALLEQLREALGMPSFEHDNGVVYAVMARGEKWFWRPRPNAVA